MNFQFHYCKFSKQRNFILFITTSALVEGGEGEVSPALSWKSEESALMLGKKALILIIYRLNSLKFFMEEKPEMFPYSAFHFLVFGECQSVLIPRKLLCPDKFLVTHLYLMTYLRIAQEKNRFIDSLVEHFTKIMKMLNVPIFSFIIINLVKKGILDLSVTTASDIYLKEDIESCFRRALLKENSGSNESINLNYHCNKLVN